MSYTYITIEKDNSWLHCFMKAMVVFQDGSTWEFIHNFPLRGPVTIEKLLCEWRQTTTTHNLNGFVQYVMNWRDRKKWKIFRNKHFYDCFVIPNREKATQKNTAVPGDQWWKNRF